MAGKQLSFTPDVSTISKKSNVLEVARTSTSTSTSSQKRTVVKQPKPLAVLKQQIKEEKQVSTYSVIKDKRSPDRVGRNKAPRLAQCYCGRKGAALLKQHKWNLTDNLAMESSKKYKSQNRDTLVMTLPSYPAADPWDVEYLLQQMDLYPQGVTDNVIDLIYNAVEKVDPRMITAVETIDVVGLLAYSLYTHASWTQIGICAVRVVRKFGIKRDRLKSIMNQFEALFSRLGSRGFTPQNLESGPNLDFGSFLTAYTTFRNSEFYSSIQKCLSTLFVLVLADKEVPTSMMSKIHHGLELTLSKMDSLPVIESLITSMHFILTRGWQCLKTGSLSPIFHSASAYTEWYKESADLIDNSMYLANPEAHDINVFHYAGRISACIEVGQCILGRVQPRSAQFSAVRKILNQLKSINSTLVAQDEVAKMRMSPFCLEIFGASSVAKSFFMDILFKHYAKIRSLPDTDEYRYTKNCAAKYWDGFRSHMWCCIFDDVAYLNPNVGGELDPSLAELIKALNNISFCPDQAALEDKGKTPFKCELVLVSTNTIDLNANVWFSHPFAVQRRMGWAVRIVPKSEFKRKDTDMIDPTKLPEVSIDEYPDWWDIYLYNIVPDPNAMADSARDPTRHVSVNAKYVLVKLEDDLSTSPIKGTQPSTTKITTFIRWYSHSARAHILKQRQVLQSSRTLSDTKVCLGCDLPINQCIVTDKCSGDCYKPQNGESIDIWYFIKQFFIFFFSFIWASVWPLWSLLLQSGLVWLVVRVGCRYDERFRIWCDSLRTRAILKVIGVVCPAQVDWLLSFAGELASIEMCLPNILSNFMAGILLILTFRRLWSSPPNSCTEADSSEICVQGGSLSTEIKPDSEVKRDYYYNETVTLSKLDIPRKSSSWHGLPEEVVNNYIRANLYTVRFYYNDSFGCLRKSDTLAFSPCGFLYLINAHSVPQFDRIVKVVITSDTEAKGVRKSVTVQVDSSSFEDDGSDIMAFYTKALPPNKDLRELFGDDAILKSSWACRFMTPKSIRHSTTSKSTTVTFDATSTRQRFYTNLPVFVCSFDVCTDVGDCGGPYIGESPRGPVILGLHIAKNDLNNSICQFVTRSAIDSYIGKRDFMIVQSGTPQLVVGKFKKEIIPLDKKSGLRFYETGSISVYGSILGGRATSKGTVVKSLAYKPLAERGFKCEFGNPKLTGWRQWRNSLEPTITRECKFKPRLLAHIEDCMVEEFSVCDLGVLQKYSLEVAINGAPGIAYVNGVKRTASAGFPFNCSSSQFQVDLPDGTITYNDDIMSEVARIQACYDEGRRACPVFTACPKDEPRKFKKIEEEANRIFMGSSRAFLLVSRQYFLSSVRLIQNNRFVTEAAPGLCAQNREWHELGVWLRYFGTDTCIDGDFKNFDKNQSSAVLWVAFNILIRLHERAGWSQHDLRVLWCIACDIIYAFVNYDGDLVEFFGSNPSGQLLTVIINGLVNCVYMRYCYCLLGDGTCNNFKDNVHLMTYGDDNVMNVNPSIPWFNHTAISEVFSSLDLVYTMADKTRDSQPYVCFGEMSFLKRKWRFDTDLGHYLAPLDETSIIGKGVMVGCESLALSREEWTAIKLKTASEAYFFHGRDKFEEMLKLFQEVYEELGFHLTLLGPTVKYFRSYEHLKNRWLEASGYKEPDDPTEDNPFAVCEWKVQNIDSFVLCQKCFFEDCSYSIYELPTNICWCCSRCKASDDPCLYCECREELCPCQSLCGFCHLGFDQSDQICGPFYLFLNKSLSIAVWSHAGCYNPQGARAIVP